MYKIIKRVPFSEYSPFHLFSVRCVQGFARGCCSAPAKQNKRCDQFRQPHQKNGEGFAQGSRFKCTVTSYLFSVCCKHKTPRVLFFRSLANSIVASETATVFSRSHVIRILSITIAVSALLFAFCALNFTFIFLQSFSAFTLSINISLLAFRITLEVNGGFGDGGGRGGE